MKRYDLRFLLLALYSSYYIIFRKIYLRIIRKIDRFMYKYIIKNVMEAFANDNLPVYLDFHV